MPQASPKPGSTLLSPIDHTLMLIDYQPQMAFATRSIDGIELRNNVSLVAKTASAFDVPTMLTTLSETSFSGPILGEIGSVLSDALVIDRTTMNCWEDARVSARLNQHGTERVVLGGLWTSVCVLAPALSALDQGFEVYVIADACGDVSADAHGWAMERMIQEGARPLTSVQYLLELQRDWARHATAGRTGEIVTLHGDVCGIGFASAARMIGARSQP